MNDFNAQNYFNTQMLDSVDYGNECGKKVVNMKLFYTKKRDEMYLAYQVALESEDMQEAERLFKEYEAYKKMAG
jgi:hypothetical protein